MSCKSLSQLTCINTAKYEEGVNIRYWYFLHFFSQYFHKNLSSNFYQGLISSYVICLPFYTSNIPLSQTILCLIKYQNLSSPFGWFIMMKGPLNPQPLNFLSYHKIYTWLRAGQEAKIQLKVGPQRNSNISSVSLSQQKVCLRADICNILPNLTIMGPISPQSRSQM